MLRAAASTAQSFSSWNRIERVYLADLDFPIRKRSPLWKPLRTLLAGHLRNQRHNYHGKQVLLPGAHMNDMGQMSLFPHQSQNPSDAGGPCKHQSYKEPVLVSLCFLGVPCRWHGRRAKRRDTLIARLKEKYVIVPVCPEQLGGMPTPRTGETLRGGTGAQVLDDGWKLLAPGTNEDVTAFHVRGAAITLEIAQQVGARRAYLKGGSPSCDKDGVTGETLRRGGIHVVRVG